MIGLRSDLVHLPRIFVELHSKGFGDALAFINERVEQVAKVSKLFLFGKMKTVGKFCKRSDGVYRGIEDEFGPLRGTSIFERHSLKAKRIDQLRSFLNQGERRFRWFKRTHPRGCVELIAHMRVGDARAAHKSCAPHDVSVSQLGDD